jgi:hypothetical protein
MGRQTLYCEGVRFGQLVILRRVPPNRALVRCDCGTELELTVPALTAGKKDCGHVARERARERFGAQQPLDNPSIDF